MAGYSAPAAAKSVAVISVPEFNRVHDRTGGFSVDRLR
ncbi:hypothetical protein YPPY13_4590 [Yersinia pestis PY-13]|nr:hypothetical protein YPPY04_4575 [Yersinia pestis PY-04]EIR00956.1 hypothetical protein YPPY06_4612 [Yersinia pestis PY-06]EIR40758.1 hypothetical protein YPPY13_4590 [Yersinia pestis PY-13]EIR41934.1 hypothetical protein YPPY15_4539 [Yersinia pestis PY-15]EIR70380.1 hypothetical protein YPPY34_4578 [Yersinia pestis PY-34]EIR82296.1 hypothetical protein YPPY36_4725 [Yersinia pestis PY-36]EIR99060.1 hypothetical protein YPPY46_4525 [Yersinia pestis PY-46]EIS51546.1 hypothetical protein YPP